MVIISIGLLIVGFSSAADHGFGQASSYGVIIAGVVVFAIALIYCMTTKRNAIIPAVGPTHRHVADCQRLFKIRTTSFFVVGSFFNSLMFMPVAYLLPQFFQGVSLQLIGRLYIGTRVFDHRVRCTTYSVHGLYICFRLHR